jgi:hypothetical protein
MFQTSIASIKILQNMMTGASKAAEESLRR